MEQPNLKTGIDKILKSGEIHRGMPLHYGLSADELKSISEALAAMEHDGLHEQYIRTGFPEWMKQLIELTADCSVRASLVDRLVEYRKQNPELCSNGRLVLDMTIGEHA